MKIIITATKVANHSRLYFTKKPKLLDFFFKLHFLQH